MSTAARLAGPERYLLAEGILWDDRAGEAVFVDIAGGDLVRNLDTPVRTHLDTTVGAVALAEDGGYLVAGHRGLITVAPDGAISRGPDLLRQASRFNDGIVDPQGRFLVGGAPLGVHTNDEQLLRISPDGTVEVLREGITLSNGLGFLADGTLLHVDTYRKTVNALRDGTWEVMIDGFTGTPDGITVDAEDCIWVAHYDGFEARRYTQQGELIDVVTIGTQEATCVGFIGPDLATLAITSAQESATDELAGAIFVSDVGVRGRLEHRWAGSTVTPYWA